MEFELELDKGLYGDTDMLQLLTDIEDTLTINFECYPNYSITRQSKNIEDTLNLQFKLLTDIGLQPENDALSFYYRGLYIFSNTNFPIKDVKQTGKITVDPIFSTISTIISPPIQEAKVPALIDF